MGGLTRFIPTINGSLRSYKRNKSFTAPFVSEAGAPRLRGIVNGVDQAGVQDSKYEENDDSCDDVGGSSDDGHLPVGGKKKFQPKMSKAISEEELIANVEAQWHEVEKEKLEYSKRQNAREHI
ncbi:hypothetical protein FN846DRAFT_894007 [Sphaerosporella brunnea]|uniref:Uncharacterized protein n=1 Tax=Sphaerosporella brunnea TaxID=1250544 RepID=A0A5J5EK79_9PEZI|nr:hypothetical protein FN846DRAFT_894007 [Sphaerosporella brunnea]